MGISYFTLSGRHTWYEAQQMCEDRGARLAEIQNEAQLDLVINIGTGNYRYSYVNIIL